MSIIPLHVFFFCAALSSFYPLVQWLGPKVRGIIYFGAHFVLFLCSLILQWWCKMTKQQIHFHLFVKWVNKTAPRLVMGIQPKLLLMLSAGFCNCSKVALIPHTFRQLPNRCPSVRMLTLPNWCCCLKFCCLCYSPDWERRFCFGFFCCFWAHFPHVPGWIWEKKNSTQTSQLIESRNVRCVVQAEAGGIVLAHERLFSLPFISFLCRTNPDSCARDKHLFNLSQQKWVQVFFVIS